jgi:hypothetical protein
MQYIGDEPRSSYLAVVSMAMILVFVAGHSLAVFLAGLHAINITLHPIGLVVCMSWTPFLLFNIMMGNSLAHSRKKKLFYIEIRHGESTYSCFKTCGCRSSTTMMHLWRQENERIKHKTLSPVISSINSPKKYLI